jgi:hypothetical protein
MAIFRGVGSTTVSVEVATTAVELVEGVYVAETVAEPFNNPLAKPFASTETVLLSDELHVTDFVKSAVDPSL